MVYRYIINEIVQRSKVNLKHLMYESRVVKLANNK